MRESCIGCLYYRPIAHHGNGVPHVCHYLHDTGDLRACDPGQCNKKKIASPAERKKHVVKLAQTRFMR